MKTSTNRDRRRGFSLIELLIVLTILVILSAMAVPNFFRAKLRANESSAVASLRSIATMQISYETSFLQGYAPSLAALGPTGGGMPNPSAADLLDPLLAAGMKSGYEFIYSALDTNGDLRMDFYAVRANPLRPGTTGDRFFYVDQTNIIRWAKGAAADQNSTPVPE